jgi:hypothetical protein
MERLPFIMLGMWPDRSTPITFWGNRKPVEEERPAKVPKLIWGVVTSGG